MATKPESDAGRGAVAEAGKGAAGFTPVNVDVSMHRGEPSAADRANLLRQYGCGAIPIAGGDHAFFDRHLVFDNVAALADNGPRERFEAFALSVRGVLSQRWVRTEETYARENPKRVYYLSMEFLIGRSLANNLVNLMIEPLAKQAAREKALDWFELLEQEPDAGLGNGGLGRRAA